jgi:hypothetical protein
VWAYRRIGVRAVGAKPPTGWRERIKCKGLSY